MFKVLLEVLMSPSSSATVCPHLCVHSNVHLEHPLTASANIHIVVGVISQRNDYCIARAKTPGCRATAFPDSTPSNLALQLYGYIAMNVTASTVAKLTHITGPTNSLACKPRSENSNTAGRSKT
jgi:hypothetical protein